MITSTRLPHSSRSFSATLAIAFFALSVVAILLSGALLYLSLRTEQESVSTNLRLVATDAALVVKGFFQEKFASLETFAVLVTPTTVARDQNTLYLESILGQQPGFRQVALLDSQAHEIASASRLSVSAIAPMLNRIDSAATTQLKQGNRFVSSVYLDPTTNEPLVLLAVPVKNPFGEVVGSVVAELNVKFMWDLVDQLQVGQSGYAFVIDRQGDLLAYRNASRVLKGENLKQLEEVSQFVNSGATSQVSIATANGIEGQNVAAAFVPLGAPDWALVTELPVAEAYRTVTQNAIVAGVILFAILAMSALAGLILARRLSSPLIDLTETATRISAGELDLQARVAGPSEVSRLAIAFNTMTARLRQTLAGLETRVTERTHELAASKDELENRNKELEASQQKLEQGQKELAETNTELQQASQYLNALNDTALGLLKHLSIQDLLQTIVSRAAGLVQTDNGYLYLSDTNQSPMILRVGTGLYENLIGAQATRDVGLAGQVWQTGKVLAIADYQNWAERLPGSERAAIQSAVGVPLTLDNTVVGILGLAYTEQGRSFGENEIQVLNRFARLATIALENARLFEQTQTVLNETQIIYRATRNLSHATDLDSLLRIAVEFGRDQGLAQFSLALDNRVKQENPTAQRSVYVAMWTGKDVMVLPPLASNDLWNIPDSALTRVGEQELVVIHDLAQPTFTLPPDLLENMQLFDVRGLILGRLAGTGDEYYSFSSRAPLQVTNEEFLTRIIGFAAQLTTVLQNQRLYEQTQTALAEMRRVNEFSTELNQLVSLESLLEIASRSAFQNGAKSANLLLIENDALGRPEYGKVVASINPTPGAPSPVGARYRLADIPLSSLLLQNTDNPVILPDVLNDPRFDPSSRATFRQLGDLANVFLPLRFQGQWLAYFAINWSQAHEFSDSEQRLYRLMMSPLALALNNRLSFQKTEEALEETVSNADRMRVLNELSSELNRASDLDEIIKLATDKFPDLMRQSEASLALLAENPELVRVYGVRDPAVAPTLAQALPLANTAMEVSLRERRMVHIPDLSKVNYLDTDVMRNFGIKSTLIVPLIGTNNQTYGTMSLTNRSAVPFSSQDQQMMVQLGALLTSAIENRRLFEQTQQALARAQELAERERQSAEQIMSLNRRLTSEGWEQFSSAQQGAMWVEDSSTGMNGNGHMMPELARAEETGLTVTSRINGHSTVAVPIVVRGEVIGTIGLEDFDSGLEWSEDRMGIINDVVENLGLALDNARLFTETQRRVTELDALNHISQAVSSELDLETLLTTIGSQLRSIFDVQNAYIALYDRERQTISLPYFVNDNERVTVPPIEFGEGLSSQIIRTRKPMLLNQDVDEAMGNMSAKVFGRPALSYLGVPIFVGDEVTGVISIQSTARAGVFDESNIRLLETIAATVGTAIQGAQLFGAMQQEVVTRQRAEEEIKLSLKEKEVLLKEIHHRVKNNLQIITSLLNLQSAQIKDPEAVMLFRESQSRVRSMALIHEKLYQSKDLARIDFDGYLRDLMIYLFRSYAANPEQIRFHVESNNMYLGIDTAIPCGLMISELVTNTIKYAFPNGRKGNLWISIGPEDDGHLTLLVKDDGVGFKEGFDWRESDSLGLQLVSTLSSQLHGTLDVNGVGGTSFKITFPG